MRLIRPAALVLSAGLGAGTALAQSDGTPAPRDPAAVPADPKAVTGPDKADRTALRSETAPAAPRTGVEVVTPPSGTAEPATPR